MTNQEKIDQLVENMTEEIMNGSRYMAKRAHQIGLIVGFSFGVIFTIMTYIIVNTFFL